LNEDITKKNLDQSIELISEFNFDEEDYETIFEKFQIFLNNSKNHDFLKKISEIEEFEDEKDLKAIMKKLSNKFKISELNTILKEIVKNEEFVDFIQDLFLEKLL
jgi:hypothetical protein